MVVKCRAEPSDYFVIRCLSQTFLNDPYDMGGPKEPVVCACEADLDGALTMEIFKLMTEQTILFYDLRHYDAWNEVYVFSNCGSTATFCVARSGTPEENLKQVSLYPQTPFYYPGGGVAGAVRGSPWQGDLCLSRREG